MKVKELMERCNTPETGKVIAYIKDGLEEINILAETHIETERVNLEANKRFYDLPDNMLKLIDIRVKNHLNSKDEYRTIPRLLYPPLIKDADAV